MLPFISIVSLNWNSASDTLRLLKSIENSDYPKNKYEVIVVDNGSTDGSVEKIKKYYPKTKIISLQKNLGVWVRNFAFDKARGEIIVTLDSDAILPNKDTLRQVVEKVRKDPEIGILGIKVINKRTKLTEYSPMYLNLYTGTHSMGNPNKETSKATWVPFILSAFPKKTLAKVGMLYRAFFYGEDLNFCLKIKRAGLKVLYWPRVFIYHNKGKQRVDVPHSVKYYHYYKSLFRNIYSYGNLLQKISATFFQLFIIPPVYLFYFRKKPLLKERWWGFWWNIKGSKFETKLFLIALITGTVLRIFAIGRRDFWFDEAFTYHLARLPLAKLLPAVLTDNNPPLYYFLIHFVLEISQNQIVLRLPSLILNLVAACIISKISKKAATLFLVSPLAIYMSSEARLHSLALLLAILIVKSLKNKFRFIVLSILGLFTQYYIALLLVALFVNTRLKRILVPLLFLTPWIIASMTVIHNWCACPNTLLSLPATLVSPAVGGVGEFSLRFFPKLDPFSLTLFSITATVATMVFIKKLFQNSLYHAYYLIPLITLSIAGFIFPVFSPKAFAIFSPFYFLILTHKLNRKILVSLMLLFTVVSITQIANPKFAGANLKDIYRIVASEEMPIAHTSTYTYYSLNYYAKGLKNQVLLTTNPLSPQTVTFIGGTQSSIDPTIGKFWLIDSKTWVNEKSYYEIKTELLKKYSIEKNYNFGVINLILLAK